MASVSDENIRINSVFRQFPNDIWSNKKKVFLNIDRDWRNPNNKIRHGYLITHDDMVYVVGDNASGLLGFEQSQMNSIGSYQLNLSLSFLKIEDIQVGSRVAAARTETGKLLVWGSGVHGIAEPEGIQGQGFNYGSTAIVHHYCGSDYVMAVTVEGEMVYFKPNMGSVSSRRHDKLVKLWSDDVKVPAFRWCGGTHAGAFALTTSGKLYSWGKNKHAELGRFTVTKPEEAVGSFPNYKLESLPEMVEIPRRFIVEQVACGVHHAAALTRCGKLYLWGTNVSGVLGDGSESVKQAVVPQLVTHFQFPVMAFATSKIRPVIVCQLSNGKVYAWGALSRRLMASTPVPVRTDFSDITTALIHFDMEFQKSWELKRTGWNQTRKDASSGDERFMQSLMSTPSVSTFMPSTPSYGSSTPVYAPSTPLYAPSTPLYGSSTPLYGSSTPLYAPSTPVYTMSTPTYAPPTPLYSEDFEVLDYNHGCDPGTPLYDEPNRSPPPRLPSPLSTAIKATLAAPLPPPEPSPASPPPPPPPGPRPATPPQQKTRNLLDQYYKMMNSLNLPTSQTVKRSNKRTAEPTIASTSGTSSRTQIQTTTIQPSIPLTKSKSPIQPDDNPWILPPPPPPPPMKKPRFSDPPGTQALRFNSSHNGNKNFSQSKSAFKPCPIKEHVKTFSVNSTAAGAVIGHGGGNIRYLTRKTGATIRVLGAKNAGHQLVQITAKTAKIVQNAYEEIQELILPYQGRK